MQPIRFGAIHLSQYPQGKTRSVRDNQTGIAFTFSNVVLHRTPPMAELRNKHHVTMGTYPYRLENRQLIIDRLDWTEPSKTR